METLLKTILALSVGGTVLAAVLMLLRRLLGRRLPASFTYYAWLLVLLRFVLPLPGLLAVPAAPAPVSVSPAAYERSAEPSDGQAAAPRIYNAGRLSPGAGAPSHQPERDSATAPAAAAAAAETAAPDRQALRSAVRSALRSWDLWGAVYLAGAAGTAAWYIFGYARFKRRLQVLLLPARETDLEVLRALHQSKRPKLYRCRVVRTPMLLGLFRPIIVLPDRSYTPDMLSGILRHELTHYRRGDVAYKWFAVAVFILHWFNPFTRLFRREIDRACELSCDERLLRRMGRNEKQTYGELLISLAADRSLPRSVVAMSFATEKRNLKERLVHIMTYKKTGRATLALMLAATLLLAGCAGALGPGGSEPTAAENAETVAPAEGSTAAAPLPEPTDTEAQEASISVSTVDEFIGAIGPDRTLVLPEGDFDLALAASYGGGTGNQYCYWSEVYDGYELRISHVQNLTILGAGAGKTQILTEPRYANVLSFEEGCQGLNLLSFTAGHTILPGYCAGGVLDFRGCSDIGIDGCDLFGCGILGISTENVKNLTADNTVIRECSYGAIRAAASYDIRFQNGVIKDCGVKEKEFYAFDLLEVNATTGFAVLNTEFTGNNAQTFLSSTSSLDVSVRGCDVHDNVAWDYIFEIRGQSPVISGCAFRDDTIFDNSWYFSGWGDENFAGTCVDENGTALDAAALRAMSLEPFDTESYSGPAAVEGPAVDGEVNAQGLTVYHVSTVDEFLAAIGSDTLIVLDEGLFDLSTASSYGGYGTGSYYWVDEFDGPSLVITGLSNLHIRGSGKDKTTLQAVPRYADVLRFESCESISVEQLTAGHLKEAPGSCVGDVLEFGNCSDVLVLDCGLFGCGVNAIFASDCSTLTVADSELYECSQSGLILSGCSETEILNCDIRDCGWNGISGYGCGQVTVSDTRIFRCGPGDLPAGTKPEDVGVNAVAMDGCRIIRFENCSIHDNICNDLFLSGSKALWDGEPLGDGRVTV